MSFDFSTLVTDRTQADVSRVKELASKIRSGTASESEVVEFNSAAMKGAYNHTDLNRVTAAMEALKAKLEGYGYAVPGYQRIKVPHVLPEPEPTSRLPEGYTELTYIESMGTQYVDTGFIPNQDTRVVCDFQLTSTSGWQTVFGAWSSSSGYTNSFVFLSTSSGTFRSDFGGNQQLFDTSIDSTERFVVDKNKNSCSLSNGSAVTNSTVTFSADENLHLFAGDTDGIATEFANVKIYSCQIYNNGTLVRDFIPCINPGGEVGLYDLVTKAFFGNSGTGAFVAGAIPRELPDGYTQVEYIQSSGTQYIDTGFVPNQDTRVVAEMEYVSHTDAACGLFGASFTSGKTLEFYNYGKLYAFRFGSVDTTVAASPHTGVKMLIDFSKTRAIFDVNGEIFDVTPSASGTFRCDGTLLIHALHRSNKAEHLSVSRTYSYRIYDNGILVRDFVPCKNTSGVFGLYDLVNGVFYQNAGSGTFAAGEEVVAPATASVMVVSDDLTDYDPYTWYEFDWPTPETMTIYLLNVAALRAVFSVMKSTPSVPKDAVWLMVQEANNIEKILVDINELLMKSTQVWFYGGELFAGEV